ncbi:hypothetical protein A4A49_12541 [Nicotiana attenuata]|uniref:Uncharacterized protein n=1 Tax=Nicotiana attenuata TaxID=49451 RepID=A0A1J6IL82_NICAT|nr:hypothetical protein A4A49_12541 [Nicotiana attenuata]
MEMSRKTSQKRAKNSIKTLLQINPIIWQNRTKHSAITSPISTKKTTPKLILQIQQKQPCKVPFSSSIPIPKQPQNQLQNS